MRTLTLAAYAHVKWEGRERADFTMWKDLEAHCSQRSWLVWR